MFCIFLFVFIIVSIYLETSGYNDPNVYEGKITNMIIIPFFGSILVMGGFCAGGYALVSGLLHMPL
jgi:hypothetical protein